MATQETRLKGTRATLADRRSARSRILLSAYYCSPYKGSDWRVGWGRALYASLHFDVTVITAELSRADIERYETENGRIPNLSFVFVAEGRSALLKGIKTPYVYIDPFAYRRWQRNAYMVAIELHNACHFDAVHQVNLIGFREPGELWRLSAPFIWGPVGGTQYFPWRFLLTASWKETILESARSLGNALQLRFSPKVHRALRNAAAVLVANSDGYAAFRRYRPDCIQLLETGLDRVFEVRQGSMAGQPLRILWSGEIHFRKALHLLLQALPKVAKTMPFELRILGKGDGLARAQRLATKLGISDSCRFLGWQSLETAMEQSRWADVFVFTSLRDTSGNVMLEAMSCGVPVITFNHQGAGDLVTEESGIKVPVTSPQEAVENLAAAILSVGLDRDYLARLSQGALTRARNFLWERNAERMSSVYRNVIGKSVDSEEGEQALYAAS